METTVGQVIINDMLPEDMRDYNRVWDKKTKGKVLTDLARRHPDQFKEVSHNLLRFGARAAYETGGQSFGIEDIAPTQVSRDFQKEMGRRMQQIMRNAYRRGKTSADPEVQQEIADAAIPWMSRIDEGIKKELGDKNPFYRQAFGTGAQKPGTLRSIVGADVFYVDQNNKRVPIPVTHGYAQGLTPAEYFIQSFGTRKGMVDLQKATQDAGFLSKQLVQIAHRLVVTDKEDPDPASFDPNMPIGYPVDTDDPDNEGAFLATDVGGYKRNTLLTPKILGDLKSKGINNILIRSVMVGGPANGGVYAYDCGVREKGRLPSQGDFVGINAVQSISEPLTQGAISCLDPETEVRMGNATVKKLKDIKVGDTVLGASKEGKAFPVKVTNIFNNGIQPVYQTTFRQREYPWKKVTIKATMEHKILQVKDMENPEAKQVISPIGIGAKNPAAIIHQFGGENLKYARYESHFVGNIETLDIEVDCEDHLFILANGLIVSNSKHSGGVAGADSGKAISGFKYINQIIQVPKHFQGGATHAETDGVVGKIEDAPQGGKYIYINGIQHYVGRTQDGYVPITVKKGDRVEAGDVLTEGIPNPAMIVKYKGIGEGRRYFTNMFRNALSNAGTPVHRRNIEALSRGLINYVRLNEEVGDYAPDDVLPYSMIEKDYKPREGAVTGTPSSLEECYLERPVLHYSIGTQLRPSVIKELQKYGIKQVIAHKDPPPFESEMIRGMAHVSYDPDWATRLLGAYNKESLLEGARRGATSSAESTSYVPAITFGEGDFGHIGPLKQASVLDNFLKTI